MNECQQHLENLQAEVVDFLSSDQITALQTKQVSELYVELQDRFEQFQHQHQAVVLRTRPAAEKALQGPGVSVVNAAQLNLNIAQLRDELRNINKAVNQVNDATEVPFEQLQADKNVQDVSVMAVNQIKQQAAMQNRQLSVELQQLRDQLKETLDQNSLLRQENSKLSADLSAAQEQSRDHERSAQRLYQERSSNKEDFEVLSAERERYRAKFENIKQLYEFEAQKNATFRQEQLAKLAHLEAEKQHLEEVNEQLQEKIAEMEAVDTESAAIEVARATKTIRLLTKQINELQAKLIGQKQVETQKVEQLKSTILAINDMPLEQTLEAGKLYYDLEQQKQQNQQLAATVASLQEQQRSAYTGFQNNAHLNQLGLLPVGEQIRSSQAVYKSEIDKLLKSGRK